MYVERENRLSVQENRLQFPEFLVENSLNRGPVAAALERADIVPLTEPYTEPYTSPFSQRRAELLEELYAAVSSFVVDSAVYEGTTKDDRFRLALLKHRLPRLKELVADLNELSPVDTARKRKSVVNKE